MATVIQYCSLKRDFTYQDFIPFINRGSENVEAFGSSLASFGYPNFGSLANYGFISKGFFPSSGLTVLTLLLFVFLIISLILWFVLLPSIFIMSYRRFIIKLTDKVLSIFEKKKSLTKTYESEEVVFLGTIFARSYMIYTVVASIVIVVCSLFSIIYASNSYKEVSNLKCQASRFNYELVNGTTYSKEIGQSRWINKLETSKIFPGFNNLEGRFTMYLEINNTAERNFRDMEAYSNYASPKIMNLQSSIRETLNLKPSESDRFICVADEIYKQSPINLLEERMNRMQRLYMDINNVLPYWRAGFVDTLNNWMERINAARSPLSLAASYLQSFVDTNSYTIESLIIFLLAAIAATIVGCLISVLYVCYFVNLVIRRQEPNPYKLKSELGFLWFWVGLATCAVFLCTIILFPLNSIVFAGCDYLHKIPEHPELLQNYKYMKELIDDPTRKRFLDICLKGESEGNIYTYISPYLTEYVDRLTTTHVNLSRTHAVPFPESVIFQIQDAITIGRNEDQIIALNLNNKEYFSLGDRYLILPELVQPSSISSSYNYPNGFDPTQINVEGMKTYNQKRSALNQALASRGDTECINETTEFKEHTTIVAQLTALQNALALCVETSPNSPVMLCIRDSKNVLRCGNNSGTSATYVIDQNSIKSDIASVMEGNVAELIADTELENYLVECKQKISAYVPSCKAYYANSLYVGIKLIAERIREETMCSVNLAETRDSATFNNVLKDLNDVYSTPVVRALYRGELITLLNGRGMVLHPYKSTETDCQGLAHSLGAVTDGFCGGLFHNLIYVFVFLCFVTFFCLIEWYLTWRVFKIFGRLCISKKPLLNNKYDPATWMKLMEAHKEDKQILYQMLEESAIHPSEIQNEIDSDLLHFAAFSGDAETVEFLIEKGANINRKNAKGYTPLAVAVSEGHAHVVSVLMNSGADPYIQDEFGDTPLHSAARAGNFDCVVALCQSNAPAPTYINNDNEYALDTAMKQGHSKVEQFLSPLTPRASLHRQQSQITIVEYR